MVEVMGGSVTGAGQLDVLAAKELYADRTNVELPEVYNVMSRFRHDVVVTEMTGTDEPYSWHSAKESNERKRISNAIASSTRLLR